MSGMDTLDAGALAACEAAGAQPSALRAPSSLISWLTEHTGAVLVDE